MLASQGASHSRDIEIMTANAMRPRALLSGARLCRERIGSGSVIVFDRGRRALTASAGNEVPTEKTPVWKRLRTILTLRQDHSHYRQSCETHLL